MDIKDLSAFGLDKNEGATSLAMLEIGPSSVLEIAHKSGVNRSMLYEIIDNLIEKGLVFKSMRGKKIRFAPRKPEVLKTLLSRNLQQFEKLMPTLKSLAAKGDFKPLFTLHEGLAGIKQVFLDSLHSKEKKLPSFVGVESLNSKSEALNEFWDNEFKIEKKKQDVYPQLLIPDNKAGEIFKEKDNRNYRESRFVDAEKFNFPAEVMMYDDVSVFISYTKYEEFAVTIKSKPVADTLKMIWQLVWETSK